MATFGIAAGVAADSTAAAMMSLASAYTKTTAAWAVGSTSGALDTGVIAASTWYHVYLIRRTDTGVVDVRFGIADYADVRRLAGELSSSGGLVRSRLTARMDRVYASRRRVHMVGSADQCQYRDPDHDRGAAMTVGALGNTGSISGSWRCIPCYRWYRGSAVFTRRNFDDGQRQ